MSRPSLLLTGCSSLPRCATTGGGLVPQEHIKPVDLSNLASYETMVRLSEQGVEVLELNLPIYPLAEESVLLSLSALLWTCKVGKKELFN